MVIIGTFFAAAAMVAMYIGIAMGFQGRVNRRSQRILARKRQLAVQQACRKSIQCLSDVPEMEIVQPKSKRGEMNWQHPMTTFSHPSRFRLGAHR
jgi:hypothetical protein